MSCCRAIAFAALSLLLAAMAHAAEAELMHVFPSGQRVVDARATERHDVDHPVEFKPKYKDKAEWEKRAEEVRTQVLVSQGLWPMPEKTPLNAVVHGEIDREDYTIEKVYFASLPGHYVTGNLYRPKGRTGKLPAVLCPHGHWTNGRFLWNSDKADKKQVEIGAEQYEENARSVLQARCATLARMGCVVFHYDMVGYADSKGIEHRRGFTDVETVLRLQSQMGLQTWNSIRSLDFLLTLPDVDPARIACTGASGGGTQTLILASIEPRLAVAFPAVMVGENMQGGCVCENAPLLRVNTNNVEIVSLFAPKPLACSAANDWTRDLETRGLPEMKSIYKLYGAQDKVAAKHFPFEHNYNQVSREYMYDWFNKWLKLGQTSPVKEKQIVPVDPKELSVFDAEHPRPADATDAAGVRKYWTESNEKQMAGLAKDPELYRNVVGAALRAMVNDSLPGPDDVLAGHMSGPRAMGTVVYEKGFLTRRDADERVPAAVMFPAEWNGTVVIWAHPDGKASVVGDDGKPTAAAQKVLDAKAAILAPDVYQTGEMPAPATAGAEPKDTYAPNSNPPYAAFDVGYNRSTLANRVHDLLSAIAIAKGWEGTKSVRLVGFPKAGAWALLARAVANDAIDRAAIDLSGTDFSHVSSASDPLLLPGALKYGGIDGFVPLCTHGETLLNHAQTRGKGELGPQTKGVTYAESQRTPEEMMGEILR